MSYKLVLTYTKTDEQDWSQILLTVNNSISSTADPRDDHSRNEMYGHVRVKKWSWYTDYLERAGNTYIGWNREYISDNKLEVTHYTENENVARIFYTRFNNNVKESPYTITWKLYDQDENELQL